MDLKKIRDLIDIKPSGAILVGRHITIDGFERRPIHVITHAHADHLGGINESVKYVDRIIMTPATMDLILEFGYILSTNGLKMLFRKKSMPLRYYEEIEYNGEKIKLLPAEHIIGAAQVIVETNNTVIGYTGDFKLGGNTEVIREPDVLIMETTYGDPQYRRPFKGDVEPLLIDIVEEGLSRYKGVVIYGYHGKLQEAMTIIRRAGITAPFIMPHRIKRITDIAVKHGLSIDNYYDTRSRRAKEILREGYYVFFDHMMRAKMRRLDGTVYNVVLSGWEFSQPVRKIDEYTWLVALSDHADFDELIYYVEESRPKLVVLDGSRQGSPIPLLNELRRRGWRTIIMPHMPQGLLDYLHL